MVYYQVIGDSQWLQNKERQIKNVLLQYKSTVMYMYNVYVFEGNYFTNLISTSSYKCSNQYISKVTFFCVSLSSG